MSSFLEKLTARWQDGVSFVLGLWLIASPWVLGYTAIQAAFWAHVITCIIVGALALWLAAGDYGFGGAEARS